MQSMKPLMFAIAFVVSFVCRSGSGEGVNAATNTPGNSYCVGGDGVVVPGRFAYKDGVTITEAIKLAGGCDQRALKNKVQLIRNGESRARDVDVLQIESGKTNNIRLQPGDYVLVEQGRRLKMVKSR